MARKPPGPLHGIPINAVSGSVLGVATPEHEPVQSTLVNHIHCKKSPPHKKRLFYGRMELTLHATRQTPHGACLALGAINVRLVGENGTCSVPALKGCEGLWTYN